MGDYCIAFGPAMSLVLNLAELVVTELKGRLQQRRGTIKDRFVITELRATATGS